MPLWHRLNASFVKKEAIKAKTTSAEYHIVDNTLLMVKLDNRLRITSSISLLLVNGAIKCQCLIAARHKRFSKKNRSKAAEAQQLLPQLRYGFKEYSSQSLCDLSQPTGKVAGLKVTGLSVWRFDLEIIVRNGSVPVLSFKLGVSGIG